MSNSPSSLLGHGWQPGGAETTRNKKLDLLHRLVFERHRNLWVRKCLVARTPFFWNITQRLSPPVLYPRPRRPKKWERICVTFNKRYRALEEKKNDIFKLLLMSCSRIWLKFLMFGHSNVTALLLRHALKDSYKPSSQLKVIEDCIQFSICILTTPNRERNHGEHFRNGIRIIKQLVSRLTTAHCAWLCHPRSY